MDLIENLMNTHGDEMVRRLSGAGLKPEQAKAFVPDASQEMLSALAQSDPTELMKQPEATQTSTILERVDIGALARRIGIDQSLAQRGMQALVPILIGYIRSQGGGVTQLLGQLGGKSGVGGLGKGLFR